MAEKKGILLNDLPSDVTEAVYQHRTSLGNNPAIPDIYDKPFLFVLTKKEFEAAKDTLREIGVIDDVEGTEPQEVLARLIRLCEEEERPYRNQLEKICLNAILSIFSVPEDSVDIDISLVDKVNFDNVKVNLDPEDDVEFSDVDEAKSIKSEVYKRRVLDALAVGAGIDLAEESSYEEIEKINPKLTDLYRKIIALNRYLLFTKENLGLTDENKMQLGTSSLFLGKDDEKPRISAQALIYPVLLSEGIHGFMELFMSHGLPKDRKLASAVLRKADFLNAEPWDMRLGLGLWKLLKQSLNDVVLEELPYLFKNISCLEPKEFNFLMKEVFAKTKKSRELMAVLCKTVAHDMEYDKFLDRMDKMNDKGVITDEYIHGEELCKK